MASARTSCSVRSLNRFTAASWNVGKLFRNILNKNSGALTRYCCWPFFARDPVRPDLIDRIRQALEPILRRVMHFYWRFARGMTLGVRGLVLDGQGRIFLVKHSYVSGWHMPGG